VIKKVFVIIMVAAVGAWYFLRDSDEQILRDNLNRLALYCSTASEEQVFETLQKVSSAVKLCADPCLVDIPSFSIHQSLPAKALNDHLLLMKKRLVGTTFHFDDTQVSLVSEKNAAIITTLRLTGKTVDGRFTDVYEIDAKAGKINGNWLFTSFGVVEFIKQ